jgi:MFS superfamily sulfate permease-like transporter
MAYATIADLPVQVGLYTCMVPMAVTPCWAARAS